jgi:DNA-binding NarL/FixJ family response regulator
LTLRILLVDDNKTFLAAVRNFLHSLPNVEVAGEAHEGKTALALAQEIHPDLVLLDIVMPGMNGLDVAAAMRSQGHKPRIVFLSMHDSQSYRTAARELGASGYVAKGDFVQDLVPLIDQISSELLAGPASAPRATGVQP